ncbi:hypothetical protein BKA70DRAFT_1324475, partial [Coprinopsis sp. MPI-PUGE-AT-0042]
KTIERSEGQRPPRSYARSSIMDALHGKSSRPICRQQWLFTINACTGCIMPTEAQLKPSSTTSSSTAPLVSKLDLVAFHLNRHIDTGTMNTLVIPALSLDHTKGVATTPKLLEPNLQSWTKLAPGSEERRQDKGNDIGEAKRKEGDDCYVQGSEMHHRNKEGNTTLERHHPGSYQLTTFLLALFILDAHNPIMPDPVPTFLGAETWGVRGPTPPGGPSPPSLVSAINMIYRTDV